MLGAINPRPDQDIAAQQALATTVQTLVLAGDTLAATASASLVAAAATIMPNNHEDDDEDKYSLSLGAIAGVAVGSFIGLLVIVYVGFKRRQKEKSKTIQHVPPSYSPSVPAPRPEMQVDGITYVPATDARAMHSTLPPSYTHFGPDMSPKSPMSTFSAPCGSPTMVYTPSMRSMQDRYILYAHSIDCTY